MRRASSLALLLALAASTLACKTPIPEDFDAYVPTELRGDVSMAVQATANDFGADEMLIISYKETQDEKLDELFSKRIVGAGFTELSSCEIDGKPASRDFIKAPAEHVQVHFRVPGDGESGPMLNVFYSKKVVELSMPESCSFTDAAKELCASLDGDTCTFAG